MNGMVEAASNTATSGHIHPNPSPVWLRRTCIWDVSIQSFSHQWLCEVDRSPCYPSYHLHPGFRENALWNSHISLPCNFETIAEAIWEGQVILGTDGSVIGQKRTYSWILSTTTLDAIVVDAHDGGFLPPPAQYTGHSLKHPNGAAIYAGLHWISQLLL
jgi:hypothetical protein